MKEKLNPLSREHIPQKSYNLFKIYALYSRLKNNQWN